MGGHWVSKAKKPHECNPPWMLWRRTLSIWECDCGQQWQIVLYAPPQMWPHTWREWRRTP